MNNSLKIREKFINKIVNKMEELEDRLDLLNKVDDKLIKKGYKINRYTRSERSQRGGSVIVEPVIDLAQMQREVAIKQRELNDLTKTTAQTTEQVAKITRVISELQGNISAYNIPVQEQNKLLNDISGLQVIVETIDISSFYTKIQLIEIDLTKKIEDLTRVASERRDFIGNIASGVDITGINTKLEGLEKQIKDIKPSGTVQSAKIKELGQTAFTGIIARTPWVNLKNSDGDVLTDEDKQQLGITFDDYEKAIE